MFKKLISQANGTWISLTAKEPRFNGRFISGAALLHLNCMAHSCLSESGEDMLEVMFDLELFYFYAIPLFTFHGNEGYEEGKNA